MKLSFFRHSPPGVCTFPNPSFAYGWQDLSAKASRCSGGLRPSVANEEALSLVPNGIDGHRPTLQDSSLTADGTPRQALEQELLARLVALNYERAAEEKRGLIRWLRPDYQNPNAAAPQPVQTTLTGTDEDSSSSNPKSKINNPQSSINPSSILPWPDRLPDQVAILRQFIASYNKSDVTPDAEALSGLFGRKNKKRAEQIEGVL